MNRRELISLLGPALLPAQNRTAAPQQPPEQTITLDVTRVNLLFSVTDKKGRFVRNLTASDFEIIEKGKKQRILEFAAESDRALRLGVLIDVSNSIRERFRFELEAATEFVNGIIRKGRDKALVVSYDTESRMITDLTDDLESIQKGMRSLRPGGGTALFDAIAFACREKLALDRPMHLFNRAVIVIGDGDDNSSRYSRDQALEFAQKAEVKLFTISTNRNKIETEGDKILKYFAEETGGLAFFPFKAQDLQQDFENISNELRNQYSILYRPEPLVLDGLFHEVRVRPMNRKDLIVRVRKGYYADKR